MSSVTARPALRWLVPFVALLAVLASFLVVSQANAKAPLPDISAQDLLVKVSQAEVDGLSGTVVQSADLGIPAIPGAADGAAGKLTSLLSGSHQLQVWYSAPDKVRLAIHDDYAETDVIRNGADVWTWDSKARKGTHTTLSDADRAGRADRKAPPGAPQTPQEAAQTFIEQITPTTEVTVDKAGTAAGRDAYALRLTPKDTASLVSRVEIAVDGQTYVPLSVKVYGPADKLAFSVAYDSVAFGRPDDDNFTYRAAVAPEEKAVPEHRAPTRAERKELEKRKAQADKDTTTVGEGWTSVVVTRLPDGATTGNDTLQSFLGQLKPVSGSWGTGRELDGTIVTAILTDDGRLAVGAVGPEAVSQALAR